MKDRKMGSRLLAACAVVALVSSPAWAAGPAPTGTAPDPAQNLQAAFTSLVNSAQAVQWNAQQVREAFGQWMAQQKPAAPGTAADTAELTQLRQQLRQMTQQRDQANTNAANVERELAVARAEVAKAQAHPSPVVHPAAVTVPRGPQSHPVANPVSPHAAAKDYDRGTVITTMPPQYEPPAAHHGAPSYNGAPDPMPPGER